MRYFIACAFFTFSLAAFAFPLVPDSQLTTGSFCTEQDEDFVEHRYEEQIPYCERNVTTSEKKSIYKKYGIPEACWGRYTIDHFYPLFLGGSNHNDNLWPEHKLLKQTRMNLEVETYRLLKEGKINQPEALKRIRDEKLSPTSMPVEGDDPCDRLDP